MSGDDRIIEAGDDGEILDASADGAIECVADGEGMTVEIDPDSDLGERLAWHAGHRGESPEELLDAAIREHLDATRADGGPTVHCSTCGERFDPDANAATFDGSTAVYRCPECGEWVEGPPPGD